MSCPSRRGSSVGKRALNVGQLRIHEDRRERDEDPRPRAQHVVRDVEEQDRAERIALGLRRQHALRDVAAAAGFRAGIPHRPPLHGNRHDEHRDRDVPVVREVGQHAEIVDAAGPAHRRQLRDQPVEPADLRRTQREVGGRDHGRHLDEELDHVDDEHAPQARVRGERDVQQPDERQRLPASRAEQHAGDLAGRKIHRRHDHAVEQQAEVDRAKAADDRRGLPGIADLVELEVGHDARPPPQPRVEEDRRDARQHERPPHPVPRHAVAPDDVGDEVGRVAAEGRGDHREPGEPPRHGAARHEEFRRAAARPLAEEERRHEADEQADRGDDPVEGCEMHEAWRLYRRRQILGDTDVVGRAADSSAAEREILTFDRRIVCIERHVHGWVTERARS